MMERPPQILCYWPGLAGLWLRGGWLSLLVAVGFSIVLNLALVSTWVWPDWLDSTVTWGAWVTVAVGWLIGYWSSCRVLVEFDKLPQTVGETDDTLFIQAQTEYLKGEYRRVELLMIERLREQPRDAEARLLLAAAYRRMGRGTQALQQLTTLKRIDAALPWRFEMERERRRLEQKSTDRTDTNEPLQDEDTPDSFTGGTVTLGEAAGNDVGVEVQDEKQSSAKQPRAA